MGHDRATAQETHKDCVISTRPAQNQASSHFSLARVGSHEVPSLAEKLLAIDGCFRMMILFFFSSIVYDKFLMIP